MMNGRVLTILTILVVTTATRPWSFKSTLTNLNQTYCDPNSVGVEPIQNFDFDRLYSKEWYVQEIFVRRPEDVVVNPGYNCFMQVVKPHMGQTAQLIEQYTDIESGVAVLNGSYVDFPLEGNVTSVWSLTRNYAWKEYRAIVTHTDYESYGVMHWCPWPDAALHPYERVLTFTGVPTPEQGLLDELRDNVASLGFPTEYAVQIDHHADCDYDLCPAKEGEICCDPSAVSVPPIPDIDLERLLDKPWFVQEIFFRESPNGSSSPSPPCLVHYIYPYLVDLMYFVERYSDENGHAIVNSSWVVLPAPDSPEGNKAIWELIGEFSLDKHTTTFTHIDYLSYGLMHWCPYPENVESKVERVFILTGTPSPDEALLDELREQVASSLDFPTGNGVRIHHHAECDYGSPGANKKPTNL